MSSSSSSTNQDFSITNDEYDRLKESFKKKEFRDLFVQYMQDLSDPKFRDEQEKYFAELAEEQNKQQQKQQQSTSSDSLSNPMFQQQSDSRRIILPKAEYAISILVLESQQQQDDSSSKKKKKKKKQKKSAKPRAYINICSSDLISKYETIPDAKNNSSQYRMPLSLGRERIEENGNVFVYDVVFHPDTVADSKKDPFMMKSVMEICCEYVETHYKKKLDRVGEVYNVTIEKECRGKPLAQTVRVKPTHSQSVNASSSAKKQSKPSSSGAGSTAEALSKMLSSSTSEKQPSKQSAASKKTTTSPSTKSSANQPEMNDELYKNFSSALMGESRKEPELDSLNVPSAATGGGVKIEELDQVPHKTPKYTIVHSGTFQIQNYTMSKVDMDRNIPEKLVVKITIPEISSAKTIDLEMTNQNLYLTEPTHNYKLDLSLPFPVDSDEGTAKFLKKSHTLVVTLPVNIPRDQLTPASENTPSWEKADTQIINENEEHEKERQERIKAYQEKLEQERQEKLAQKREHEERLKREREEKKARELQLKQQKAEEERKKREEEEALQRMLRDEPAKEQKKSTTQKKASSESKPSTTGAVTEDDNDEAALRQIQQEKARLKEQKKSQPAQEQQQSYESQYFNIDFENRYISEID